MRVGWRTYDKVRDSRLQARRVGYSSTNKRILVNCLWLCPCADIFTMHDHPNCPAKLSTRESTEEDVAIRDYWFRRTEGALSRDDCRHWS